MTLTIYDWLALLGLPGISLFLFQLIYNHFSSKIKREREDILIMKKALQALLRDRLREHYVHFIEQGWIDLDDKTNFDNMYQSYHNLGVNGVMDDMYKKIMKLPTKQPKQYKKKGELNHETNS